MLGMQMPILGPIEPIPVWRGLIRALRVALRKLRGRKDTSFHFWEGPTGAAGPFMSHFIHAARVLAASLDFTTIQLGAIDDYVHLTGSEPVLVPHHATAGAVYSLCLSHRIQTCSGTSSRCSQRRCTRYRCCSPIAGSRTVTAT